MYKIHKFIQNTFLQFRDISTITDKTERKFLIQKHDDLISRYNFFILSLRRMLHKKQFRKVINEIETCYPFYQTLTTHIHTLYIIKAQCILKIINKKLKDHPLEILNEKSRQSFSIHFWFNHLFFTLEQVVLSLRPNLNTTIDINTEQTFDIIEQVVQLHLDMLYHLSKYAYHTKQIPQLLTYFAMVDNIKYFYTYSKNPRTLNIMRRLYLMRANVLISNYDYDSSLKYQRSAMDLCFREFFILVDFDEGLSQFNKMCNKTLLFKKLLKENFIDLVVSFYLRGVCYEHLGNLSKAIEAYKQSRWFSVKFLMESENELALFCVRLERRAFIYYAMINKIKKIIETKEKQRKRKEDMRKLYLMQDGNSFNLFNGNNNINNNYNKLKNVEFFKRIIKSDKFKDFSKLEQLLGSFKFSHIEEMNGDNKKGKPKTNFIMSTIKMINTLLKRDFIDIVNGMNKIEINKLDTNNYDKIRKKIVELNQQDNNHNNNNASIDMKHSHIINRSRSSKHIQTRTISKSFGAPSLRYLPNKVEKLTYDDEIFSKSYVKKKTYLENYNQKETSFLKKILILKRNEIESEHTLPDPSKIKKDAEQDFAVKLILAKSQETGNILSKLLTRSKTTSQFISSKYNKQTNTTKSNNNTLQQYSLDDINDISKSCFVFRRNNKPDLSDSMTVSKLNNDMIKKLNKEYEELTQKVKKFDHHKQKRPYKQYKKVITLNKKWNDSLPSEDFYYK